MEEQRQRWSRIKDVVEVLEGIKVFNCRAMGIDVKKKWSPECRLQYACVVS